MNRTDIKKYLWMATFLFCLFVGAFSLAEAPDVTAEAVFRGKPEVSKQNLTDANHFTAWSSKKGFLEMTLPEEQRCFGVMLCFRDHTTACEVRVPDENGGDIVFRAFENGETPHQYVVLPGVTRVTVVANDPSENMQLSEVRLVGEGETPDWVQIWEPLCEKADLMIVAAHPDDELIWFGGTIPYYGTECGKKMQVVTLTCMTGYRKSELLDALWTAGIRNLPEIGPFEDSNSENPDELVHRWGGSQKLRGWITETIRKYRPDVVLTHAADGEYGHMAHVLTSRYTNQAVEAAAKEADPGSWQVKKLYTHHHGTGTPTTVIRWDMPLKQFNGESAFSVAERALEKHRSQHPLSQPMEQGGKWDCTAFDLLMSTVGKDEAANDFFEHIEADCESK